MSIPVTLKELMIAGGKPVRTRPLPPWPFFTEDQIEAAAAVLRSGKINYWTGEEGRQFEKEYARYVGCEHAVALANGTVALELALLALGIGPGDEVIVTSRTFIASASCVVVRGGIPLFADVDADSQNMTAETIWPLISRRTRAIIAVHLAGWPCDMDPINRLAKEHGLYVIEDCAQAHGARYKGRPVGSLGDVAAFSFCQDKIITTGGEGGMLLTNNRDVWKSAWSYKDHGKSWEAVYERQHPAGFRWLHECIGTNWRLTEMQSSLGRSSLAALDGWVESRRQNAAILTEHLSLIPGLRITRPPEDVYHSYYKYYAFCVPEKLKPEWTRLRIQEAITAEGIPCFSGSCSEIYLEAAFPDHLRPRGRRPVCEELGATSLMFLVHPTLSADDMLDTCRAIEKVMTVASL